MHETPFLCFIAFLSCSVLPNSNINYKVPLCVILPHLQQCTVVGAIYSWLLLFFTYPHLFLFLHTATMSVAAIELSMPVPLGIAHPLASKLDSYKIAME
jgi:hypothetical protein